MIDKPPGVTDDMLTRLRDEAIGRLRATMPCIWCGKRHEHSATECMDRDTKGKKR